MTTRDPIGNIIGYDASGNPIYDGNPNATKEDTAISKMYDIAGHNRDALVDKYTHGIDTYNIADEQIRTAANNQRNEAGRNSDDEWFSQQKDFQSAVENTKDQAGSSLTGSNFFKFLDLLEDYDDKIDRETRTNLRKNFDEINEEEYKNLSANVNARNELANDVEYALRQLGGDTLSQIVNINPEKSSGDKWNEWWNTGAGFYDQHKTGPAQYNQQNIFSDVEGKKNANKLTTPVIPSSNAGDNSYFTDLLTKRKRRY